MCKSWRASPLPTPRLLPSRDDGDESSAHCLGFGEKRAFLPGNWAVSAQRPGLGEKRLFQTTDRPTKPQVRGFDLLHRPPKPGSCSTRTLPSRDVAQDPAESPSQPPHFSRAETMRKANARFAAWGLCFSPAAVGLARFRAGLAMARLRLRRRADVGSAGRLRLAPAPGMQLARACG